MVEEDYLVATNQFFENYKIRSTLGLVPKCWLGFSYICSKDYDLYLNFDGTYIHIYIYNQTTYQTKNINNFAMKFLSLGIMFF